MVATSTLWASGTPTTSGSTWTNPTNATGANNAAFATFTSATSGAVGYIACSGYGAQAAIGATPASVDSVAVTVYFYVAQTARWSSVTVGLYDGTTLIGTTQTATLSATTTNSQTFTFTGVTWANLANLTIRATATKSGSTSSTFNVDAAGVVVNYTPATGDASVAATVAASTATAPAPAVTGDTGGGGGTPTAPPVIASSGAHTVVTSGTTLSLPVPSGVAVGSKIIAHVAAGWASTTAPTNALFTPPAGFSFAYGQAFTDATDSASMYEAWFEKTATAADTGTYAFTISSDGSTAPDLIAGVAMRVTGAADPALGDILHISPTNADSSLSQIAIPAFTPAQANCLLVAGAYSWGGTTSAVPPSGWTTLGSAAGGSYGGTYTAYQAVTTPAATGPLTFNLNSSDYSWGSIATLLGAPSPDATVTADVAAATATAPAPTVTITGGATVDAPAAASTATAPAPDVTATGSANVDAPAATVTATAPTPTVTGGGATIPTLSGETSRTTGTTTGGTGYTKITGTLANATSGSSDGYVGYFPTAITSNITLFYWNHPFASPYDADIAGTGDSGWTFTLTQWLLDHGIAIVSSNDAGDAWGDASVMTCIDNLVGAINTAMGIGKLIQYGESMGCCAALNWAARHNTSPLVGVMTISGVCDTRDFPGFSPPPDGGPAYNPVQESATSWTGLPIFMASSPSDNTVNESENTDAFITLAGGSAVITHVETTGDHLTAGSYPVSSMESWISGLVAGAATVTPPAATLSASAPAPAVTATADATVAPPAATVTATSPTPAVTTTEDATATADVGALTAAAPAPAVTADADVTAAPATDTATAPTPGVTGTGDATVTLPAAAASTVTAPTPAAAADADVTAAAATETATALAPHTGEPASSALYIGGVAITPAAADLVALYVGTEQIWP